MATRRVFEICRKGSPLAAAAMGAAVCLSGGEANAVSGNISASNGGNQAFYGGSSSSGNSVVINMFGGLAGNRFHSHGGQAVCADGGGSANFGTVGAYVQHLAAGVEVSALAFGSHKKIGHNQSNNYIGVRFDSGGVRYGWVHVVSTDATGRNAVMDTWAYDATGGGILTLDESISPKKLALSDGRVKLNWSNANEAGVARYEVQAKGANGAWSAVDSSVPGEGSYASTVAAGDYRLVVENSDGSSREVAF